MKIKIDIVSRLNNKAFWIAVFAFIALTGKVFALYEVPADWDAWVNVVLALLTAVGIIIDPSTNGIFDKEKV